MRYFRDFVALDRSAAQAVIGRGIRLVGLDALSVDLGSVEGFPVHRALLGRGVVVVEGLRLAEVPPGPCDLVCLPLRIRGGDGAPARVLVRPRRPGRTRGSERGSRR